MRPGDAMPPAGADAAGTLMVVRGPHPAGSLKEEPAAASPQPAAGADELFLVLDEKGGVTAYNGHVDLGTGIRTALAQIVADELDVAFDSVAMVLGDMRRGPNQGATIASETIQVTAIPLRQAAAQARRHLVGLAAVALDVPPEALEVVDGVVRGTGGGNLAVSYGELVRGRTVRLYLDPTVPVKPPSAYRVVGQRVARTDIPAKATGDFVYVHDVRVPGMLHGRVVRPPYAGLDAGPFVGRSLIGVDKSSIAGIAGIVAVVVIADFIGIVAEREENAEEAARRLKTEWRFVPPGPDLNAPERALREQPSQPRVLLDRGDVAAALEAAAVPMRRTYVWPYQMHGSIGPSCSVADVRPDGVTVWSGTQNPQMLRTDLARLLARPEPDIVIHRHEAAGCYGRNCADDVGADAVLLSRAVGRPVRVQLTRAQEHAWEPKGAAQVMDVEGGLTAAGDPAAYDFATRYPSNGAPTLALLLTGLMEPSPQVFAMGDRTAIPPYAYPHARVVVHDMAPIARASWLRGVSALPNSFAHEVFIDELATAAGVDPIAYRLRYLPDERAAGLVRSVAARAGWEPHAGPGTMPAAGEWLQGRGFAYAVYVHGQFPGTAAAWAAWVAEVGVNRATGEVVLNRVVVGQDAGLMINPAGVEHQIHGNVLQSASRVLKEEVVFERGVVASRDWGGYPIMTFSEVPAVEVLTMPRPHDPPLGAGESASVPSAAAIANAIFDATGVRFREPPFTPERVRAALNPLAALTPPAPPVAVRPARPRLPRRWLAPLAGIATAAIGLVAGLLPGKPAFEPIPRPDPAVFSAATIERGRLMAAAGDCAVCHEGPAGRYAGGRALETPFGTVYAANISPDVELGIGAWSYPAFERAMREGVSRDGRNLYPAHPYPSFTKAGDADLQAIYAYLMTQPASASQPPQTALAPPFHRRELMTLWNALFLRTGPLRPDPARDARWARGAALVEGLGHCGACHSPRNLLGAERGGRLHLAGGVVDGWEAPALQAASAAPVAWTEAALFDYLSTGFSAEHGVAAGPMAAVVTELATLPAEDRRAMAAYLASLQAETPDPATIAAQAAALQTRTATAPPDASPKGARIFAGACGQCHEADAPTQFGVRPSLALNTGVHSAAPDNLIRVVLEGIMAPARSDLGTMPAFADSLSDGQVADLVRYVRARFAPDAPAWLELEARIARLRAAPSSP